MLKEIFEQSATIQKALLGRIDEEKALIDFEKFSLDDAYLRSINNIWLLGCGTSAHAGWIGTLFFEDFAHLPATVEIASEARYRSLQLTPETLVIAISQSGETADTIAAMREAKRRGCKILGICNVVNSTLSRDADDHLPESRSRNLRLFDEGLLLSSGSFSASRTSPGSSERIKHERNEQLFGRAEKNLRPYPASS